jgi:hypothetical protein
MRELLPVVFGVLLGIAFLPARRRLARFAFPVAVVLTGVSASAINGEIGGNWAALFVSFDMLQVAVCATAVPSAMWAWRRHRREPVHQ